MNIHPGPSTHRLWLANALAVWSLRKHAMAHWYSIANTLAIVLLFNVGIYFAFFERPWLSYENSPFPILSAGILHPGDTIAMTVKRCSTADLPRIYPIARELRGPALPHPIIMKSTRAPIDWNTCVETAEVA